MHARVCVCGGGGESHTHNLIAYGTYYNISIRRYWHLGGQWWHTHIIVPENKIDMYKTDLHDLHDPDDVPALRNQNGVVAHVSAGDEELLGLLHLGPLVPPRPAVNLLLNAEDCFVQTTYPRDRPGCLRPTSDSCDSCLRVPPTL